jgi:hypothetical protein
VLPLDDVEAFERMVLDCGTDLAAVLIEPVPANNGLLLQRAEFLMHLRRRTRELGALLIFDEVISGFRVARGGAAQHYGIEPDLATFGKVIGGGMPVGAFGGRAEIMDHLAPLGPVYQAGTLSGNPVAMAAGLATLAAIDEEDAIARTHALGERLAARMTAGIARQGLSATFVRLGSVFWLALQREPAPRRAEALDAASGRRYARCSRTRWTRASTSRRRRSKWASCRPRTPRPTWIGSPTSVSLGSAWPCRRSHEYRHAGHGHREAVPRRRARRTAGAPSGVAHAAGRPLPARVPRGAERSASSACARTRKPLPRSRCSRSAASAWTRRSCSRTCSCRCCPPGSGSRTTPPRCWDAR